MKVIKWVLGLGLAWIVFSYAVAYIAKWLAPEGEVAKYIWEKHRRGPNEVAQTGEQVNAILINKNGKVKI